MYPFSEQRSSAGGLAPAASSSGNSTAAAAAIAAPAASAKPTLQAAGEYRHCKSSPAAAAPPRLKHSTAVTEVWLVLLAHRRPRAVPRGAYAEAGAAAELLLRCCCAAGWLPV